MIFNCLITGVGGQGTALLSRIIGLAAMNSGLDVRGMQTAGMARRGSSVVSHIRMGQDIQSPLVPRGKADIIIALEPAEAVRVYTFLSPAGRILVSDQGIMPPSGTPDEGKYDPAGMLAFLRSYLSLPSEERLAQKGGGDWLTVVSGEELNRKCGSAGVLNTALLGIAVGKKFLPFTAEHALAALKELIPPQHLELNIRAFNAGLESAR